MIIETVKVMPWGDDQGDYVVINADDFDPETHEMYVEAIDDASADDIVTAISALDAANDDHWTKAGLPDVSVLADLIGKKVTRAAIEAASDAKRPDAA